MLTEIIAFIQNKFPNPFAHSLSKNIYSRPNEEKQGTLKIMEFVKPYFLSSYKDAGRWHKATRQINGTYYVVNRYNHGLAHGLRQGALAKDVLEIMIKMKTELGALDLPELNELAEWIITQTQCAAGKDFFLKVELTSSFQRSGRQSEVSQVQDIEKYKRYEQQDAVNFQKAAISSNLFKDQLEIDIYAEAILWANKGNLDEKLYPDLKFLRQILRTAHTFDLRRIPSFDAERIRNDSITQLLGTSGPLKASAHCKLIQNTLWHRIGKYLEATGDRDLMHRSFLKNKFFLQTATPPLMVDAICDIRKNKIII